MRIAMLPLGYFEGIDRRLSHKGEVLVGGVACGYVGNVSMNMSTIDVTHLPGVRVGDRAMILRGDYASSVVSVERLAEHAQTIPYELLVHIPQHLRRTLVD